VLFTGRGSRRAVLRATTLFPQRFPPMLPSDASRALPDLGKRQKSRGTGTGCVRFSGEADETNETIFFFHDCKYYSRSCRVNIQRSRSGRDVKTRKCKRVAVNGDYAGNAVPHISVKTEIRIARTLAGQYPTHFRGSVHHLCIYERIDERANERKLGDEIANYSIDCRGDDNPEPRSRFTARAREIYRDSFGGITREADGAVFLAGGGKQAECAAT